MGRLIVLCLLFLGLPLQAQQKEGGIIGTGVLGQITALGSIYVNGLHIQFAPGMTLEGIANRTDLRPGMNVAALIEPSGDSWQTGYLRRVVALQGPVTGPGEVMGVPVTGTLPAEGWVQVDGFWSIEGLVAGHITPVQPGPAKATGPFDPTGRVGLLPFDGITPKHAAAGDSVTIHGSFVDGVLQAETFEKGLFTGDAPDLVLAEGFLSPPDTTGRYELIGAGIVAYTDNPGMIDPRARSMLCSVGGRSDFDITALPSSTRDRVRRLCP